MAAFRSISVTSSSLLSLLLTLAISAHADNGAVSIGNAFRSPTQFSCSSDVRARPPYTATANEIYYFVFDTEGHQYWDCEVQNVGFAKSGVFRFWGDDSHGGSELWGCVQCKWNVDEFGISLYVDNAWRYKYFWRSNGNRKLLM